MESEMKRIAQAVADHYGVPYERLVATRQQRRVMHRDRRSTEARHVAMALVREITNASYSEISRFFHLDRTVVRAACWKPLTEFGAFIVDRMALGVTTMAVGHA